MTDDRVEEHEQAAGEGASGAKGRHAGWNETIGLMVFRVGARWFAVEAGWVKEVAAKGPVTRVPTAPRHVLGVTLIRGRLVPVVDLEVLVAGAAAAPQVAATLPRIVVLEAGDLELGLVVDEVRGAPEAVRGTGRPEAGPGRVAFLRQEIEWEDRLVSLLDVRALTLVAAGRTEAAA